MFRINAHLKLLAKLLDVGLRSKLRTDRDPRDGRILVQTCLGLDSFVHAGKTDQGQLGLIVGVAHAHSAVFAADITQRSSVNLGGGVTIITSV